MTLDKLGNVSRAAKRPQLCRRTVSKGGSRRRGQGREEEEEEEDYSRSGKAAREHQRIPFKDRTSALFGHSWSPVVQSGRKSSPNPTLENDPQYYSNLFLGRCWANMTAEREQRASKAALGA